jgi:hypothetical protein
MCDFILRDTDFILQVLSYLMNEGEILPDGSNDAVNASAAVGPGTSSRAGTTSGGDRTRSVAAQRAAAAAAAALNSKASYRPDIPRGLALKAVHDIFGKWLSDGGDEYLMKVRALPNTERGKRYIDVDAFMEILQEPWHAVRNNWEEHAKFLFQDRCSVHKVDIERFSLRVFFSPVMLSNSKQPCLSSPNKHWLLSIVLEPITHRESCIHYW